MKFCTHPGNTERNISTPTTPALRNTCNLHTRTDWALGSGLLSCHWPRRCPQLQAVRAVGAANLMLSTPQRERSGSSPLRLRVSLPACRGHNGAHIGSDSASARLCLDPSRFPTNVLHALLTSSANLATTRDDDFCGVCNCGRRRPTKRIFIKLGIDVRFQIARPLRTP
ncbi:hypothetical protein L798_01262 [Zootermopsis nevadensis]|uniref:Uncharacterized protein n=1 Tax=Zootermopsis nevadensis TaxID=136037 RepID=A0A067QU20_ZOONE|nr:hypothetical protein L798_01262 [Zootermopsis nevadensis]